MAQNVYNGTKVLALIGHTSYINQSLRNLLKNTIKLHINFAIKLHKHFLNFLSLVYLRTAINIPN